MQVSSRRRRTSAWPPWRISSEVREGIEERRDLSTLLIRSRSGIFRLASDLLEAHELIMQNMHVALLNLYETICERTRLTQLRYLDSLKLCELGFSRVLMTMGIFLLHLGIPLDTVCFTGSLCGIIYHLFAGQPLTIIGSTGPVLVFETIVFEICTKMGIECVI